MGPVLTHHLGTTSGTWILYLTSQRGTVSFTSCTWWALESRTLHKASSTCAWWQDTRCSMWKVTLACRIGSSREDDQRLGQKLSQASVFALALHMDPVLSSLTESVVGIWLVNLLSGQRHSVCIVRKRIVCQCDCREWRTYYTVCTFVE